MYKRQEVKLAIGPVIDNGFYYDIQLDKALNDDDLLAIEDRMHKLAKTDYKVVREVVSRRKAVKTFKDRNEPYKVALAEEIPDKEAAYFASDGRKALGSKPTDHIAKMDVRLVEEVLETAK